MTGITLATRSYPWTTCVLTSIVSTALVTLTLNVAAHPHRDRFNHSTSRNLAMPMSRLLGGELFVEASDGISQLSPEGSHPGPGSPDVLPKGIAC